MAKHPPRRTRLSGLAAGGVTALVALPAGGGVRAAGGDAPPLGP
ncbi:MAG: hypothetical protein U5L98_08130 [Halomonas sp.]|nr:hypothetical protein [Halomonas sp.]MDZ7852600.1 hypothetical protein [Halomonas sp.]